MNMVDVKKVHRGVLLWREDILKCEKCVKLPLSHFVRNLLHKELEKYELPDEGKSLLQRQIEAAYSARKLKHPKSRDHRVLTIDVCAIPRKVRKNPIFVKGK